MGKICVDGTRCPCPPKPTMSGDPFKSAEWERLEQEWWEREHKGHLRAEEARKAAGGSVSFAMVLEGAQRAVAATESRGAALDWSPPPAGFWGAP